jgi:hypothetical protein
MSPRETYSAPRVRALNIAKLLVEAERYMRKAKFELEDLELVRDSVDGRLRTMRVCVEHLEVQITNSRGAIEKVNAIFGLQAEAGWFGNDDRPAPRFDLRPNDEGPGPENPWPEAWPEEG